VNIHFKSYNSDWRIDFSNAIRLRRNLRPHCKKIIRNFFQFSIVSGTYVTFFNIKHYSQRKTLRGLGVTNGARVDCHRVAFAVRSVGIMIKITWRRNVVCAHLAAGRTMIAPSAAPWSAGGKPCQAAVFSRWTSALCPSEDLASLRRPRTCTRTVCADAIRTDPERSWHSPRTTNSAAPSPECNISQCQPIPRLLSLRDRSSSRGTPAAGFYTVSAPKSALPHRFSDELIGTNNEKIDRLLVQVLCF